MTDLQAALGLSQLKRLDDVVNERHRLLNNYYSALHDLLLFFCKFHQNRGLLHLAVIRLLDKTPEHHHHVFEALRNSNIGVQLHYLPVHLHPYYRRLGFKPGDFPEAESYARNALSLPFTQVLEIVIKKELCNL